MTTSNSTDFTQTRNDLIYTALRLIGAMAVGETPTADDIATASSALNIMIKAWQIDGPHLWTLDEGTIFCAKGVPSYSIPGTYAANAESYVTAEMAVAGVLADPTITVVDDTGILNGDHIGILLDDGTMQWTTVNGVPVANVVTLTTALTGAAAIGNVVYTYTTGIQRPLRIHNIRRKYYPSDNEIIFAYGGEPMAKSDYLRLPNKTVQGVPIQGYYDPQLSTGMFYVWPAPSDARIRINFTYERQIEDFDILSNTPDFPQEWLAALKWNLAVEIWPEYFPSSNPPQFLLSKAEQYKEALINWSRDMGSTFIQPDNIRG
jgi:hypothetical protein